MGILKVPKEILWDYQEAPADLLWRLQRLADFFPLYGRDKDTILALYENRDKIKIDSATKALIEEYYKILKEKEEI